MFVLLLPGICDHTKVHFNKQSWKDCNIRRLREALSDDRTTMMKLSEVRLALVVFLFKRSYFDPCSFCLMLVL